MLGCPVLRIKPYRSSPCALNRTSTREGRRGWHATMLALLLSLGLVAPKAAAELSVRVEAEPAMPWSLGQSTAAVVTITNRGDQVSGQLRFGVVAPFQDTGFRQRYLGGQCHCDAVCEVDPLCEQFGGCWRTQGIAPGTQRSCRILFRVAPDIPVYSFILRTEVFAPANHQSDLHVLIQSVTPVPTLTPFALGILAALLVLANLMRVKPRQLSSGLSRAGTLR